MILNKVLDQFLPMTLYKLDEWSSSILENTNYQYKLGLIHGNLNQMLCDSELNGRICWFIRNESISCWLRSCQGREKVWVIIWIFYYGHVKLAVDKHPIQNRKQNVNMGWVNNVLHKRSLYIYVFQRLKIVIYVI